MATVVLVTAAKAPSEMLQLRIGREQLIGAQGLSSAFRLPNHLKRQQLISANRGELLKGFAQGLSRIGTLQIEPIAAGQQESNSDVIAGGIAASRNQFSRARTASTGDIRGDLALKLAALANRKAIECGFS